MRHQNVIYLLSLTSLKFEYFGIIIRLIEAYYDVIVKIFGEWSKLVNSVQWEYKQIKILLFSSNLSIWNAEKFKNKNSE